MSEISRASLFSKPNSLGFRLDQLVEGGLDRDPRMRQVFVEAIVVYSPAYRKARQAQQQPSSAAKDKDSQAEAQDGKGSKPSGSARHKNGPAAEAGEAAPAA